MLRAVAIEKDITKKRNVIKKVIAYMTQGIDVSRLYPEMVKASSTEDVVMTGRELFDTILEKGVFTEKEAGDTVCPIIDAINYCSSLNIIHRDIKPENLLFSTKDTHTKMVIYHF